MRRWLVLLAATLVGLGVGVVVWGAGFVFFPGWVFGDAALTFSDGKPPFYDRTTWWDAVPLVGAVVGCSLAAAFTRRRPAC